MGMSVVLHDRCRITVREKKKRGTGPSRGWRCLEAVLRAGAGIAVLLGITTTQGTWADWPSAIAIVAASCAWYAARRCERKAQAIEQSRDNSDDVKPVLDSKSA